MRGDLFGGLPLCQETENLPLLRFYLTGPRSGECAAWATVARQDYADPNATRDDL